MMSLEELQKRLEEEIEKNKVLELALDRKNREMEVSQKESAQDVEIKSDFLSRMSHEIRTPLNGIVGMTSLLLQDEELSEKQRHFLEVIEQSCGNLMALVDDILDYAKLEANRLKIEPVSMNLLELIRDLFNSFYHRAKVKNLDMYLDYDPAAPRWVVGDPKRICQILINLIGNALKFTKKGYILLTVKRQEGNQNAFVFEVLDTGVGVEDGFKKRIFEKFTQADSTTKRKNEGSGLGLAICKQLADAMNGQIGVKDNPEGGSIFWVSLPLEVDEENEVPFEISDRLKQTFFLVVDSREIDRRIIRGFLEENGLNFQICKSEDEGMKVIRSRNVAEGLSAVVIVNHTPPEVDAVRLLKTMREEKEYGSIPFFVVCEKSYGVCEEDMKKLDATGFVYKPVSSLKLIEEIRAKFEELKKLKEQKEEREGDESKPSSLGKGKLKVLIVEDDLVNQQVIAKMLESLECRVELAENGVDAIKKWETSNYDCILMDIKMPLVDGIEATKIIREHEKGAAYTPIIALTAQIDENTKKKCLEAKVDAFVTKPVTIDDLTKSIKKFA